MSSLIKNNVSTLPGTVLQRYAPVLLLIIFSTVVGIISPTFLSMNNFVNISQQIVPVGIISLGMMFVIITGGIDFVAGWGVAIAAVTTGVVFSLTENIFLSVGIAILIGLIIGITNGLIITRLKLQPFIVTLAVMSIVQGLTYVLSSGRYIFVRHEVYDFIGRGNLFGLPNSFIILVLVYVLGYILQNRTKLGTYTYAIGDNEEGARLAGIDIKKYKVLVYIISGLCMAIASIVIISRISLVTPTVGGIRILLDSVAAVIIGGTSITGGKGTVQGTFIGVILIGLISNALNLLNVPPVYQDVFKGGVIILALFFDVIANKARK